MGYLSTYPPFITKTTTLSRTTCSAKPPRKTRFELSPTITVLYLPPPLILKALRQTLLPEIPQIPFSLAITVLYNNFPAITAFYKYPKTTKKLSRINSVLYEKASRRKSLIFENPSRYLPYWDSGLHIKNGNCFPREGEGVKGFAYS